VLMPRSELMPTIPLYLVMKDTMYFHKTKNKERATLGLCRPVFQSCHCPYELIEGSS
jgi:hypothetical protein